MRAENPRAAILFSSFPTLFSTSLLGTRKIEELEHRLALSDPHFVYSQGTVLIFHGNTFPCGR